MLIITDKKILPQAKKKLGEFGELLLLETSNIVYPSISGHADIFFCIAENKVIIAPNLPKQYINILVKNNISFKMGSLSLKKKYPFTAYYNALVSDMHIIHNQSFSDISIMQTFPKKEYIHVNQGYTRCNLIHLKNNTFITSDKGIQSVLIKKGFNCVYINPKQIMLENCGNGFFGGCCGVFNNKLFINGSIKYLEESKEIIKLTQHCEIDIIELSNKALTDIGSIYFVE